MSLPSSARLIVEHEVAAAGKANEADAAASVERVYLRIAELFSPVIGRGGFDAIFARSLTANPADDPSSRPIDRALGELKGLPPAAIVDRGTAVLGSFLTGLSTFIGEALVLQLLRNGWPTLNLSSAADRLEKK